jgi:hypothetical protein
VVRPPDRRIHLAATTFAWLTGAAAATLAQVDPEVRMSMIAGLALAVCGDLREWLGKPSRAVWRPRKGWILEWANGGRHAARLDSSSRIFWRCLMLHWRLADGRTARMLVLPAGGSKTAMRRLRVLMRMGRSNG